jgi:hypothetical protein
MTDRQYLDLLKRVEALEASASIAKSLGGETITLYPKQVEGSGYAVKDSAGVYKAYKGMCKGALQEIETYDTEYEGKPTVRLVAILSGSNTYKINVGADTVFAKSLIANLVKTAPYIGLEIGAKPSAKKQSVVFAEVLLHGSIVKESCQDWTQKTVLESVLDINARIKSLLMRDISRVIKSGSVSQQEVIGISQRMFDNSESIKLKIPQLRALLAEISNV